MIEQEQAALDKLATYARDKGVPKNLCTGLAMYYLFGVIPGDYLNAFLTHSLRGIMSHGDDDSIAGLRKTYFFVYYHLPSACWGSEAAVMDWSVTVRKVGALEAAKAVEYN